MIALSQIHVAAVKVESKLFFCLAFGRIVSSFEFRVDCHELHPENNCLTVNAFFAMVPRRATYLSLPRIL